MPLSGMTEQEYTNLLANGGHGVLECNLNDLPFSQRLLEFEEIRPNLNTGFEVSPTSAIFDPTVVAHILLFGNTWSRIYHDIYSREGNIIYKQLPENRFMVNLFIPRQERSNRNES